MKLETMGRTDGRVESRMESIAALVPISDSISIAIPLPI